MFERSVRPVSGLEYLVNDRAGKISASWEDHLQMTGSINDEGAKVVVEGTGLSLELHIRQTSKFANALGAASQKTPVRRIVMIHLPVRFQYAWAVKFCVEGNREEVPIGGTPCYSAEPGRGLLEILSQSRAVIGDGTTCEKECDCQRLAPEVTQAYSLAQFVGELVIEEWMVGCYRQHPLLNPLLLWGGEGVVLSLEGGSSKMRPVKTAIAPTEQGFVRVNFPPIFETKPRPIVC